MPETRKIHAVNMTFREAKNPEPEEKISKGIVKWGLDNLYAQDLIGYVQDNPIHGGIVNQKVIYMSSAGITPTGLQGLEERLKELIPSIVTDFELFNGFAVLFTKSGDNWKVDHEDFECVRYMEETGMFAISDDWSAKTQSAEKTNYRKIKCISKACLSGEDADTTVLLYAKVKPKQRKLKSGKLSLCYYPVPNYAGAIISILAGIEQDYFTFSEAVNGYKGGTLISMNNGQPDDDADAEKIADKIKGGATDRDRQGGIVVVFNDSVENGTTVMSLNGNDLDKRYLESNKEILNKIMIGHSVGSRTLFAVNSGSLFGSRDEMITAYTLLVNNYIKGRQEFISESIEWAFTRLGFKEPKVIFNKYVLSFTEDATDASQVNAEKMAEAENSNNALISVMSVVGISRKDANVKHAKSYDFSLSDEDFINSYEDFADLSKDQVLILKLIKEGKSFSEVSKQLGKGALKLSLEILKLNAKGMLDGWKVIDSDKTDLEVRYSYEVKAGLGNAIIPGSRDFCIQMINLDRLYTKQEIDLISTKMDMDVWRYRGGWYHNPKTDVNTPSCRHEWVQNIVSK